jgi:hypothetical protein
MTHHENLPLQKNVFLCACVGACTRSTAKARPETQSVRCDTHYNSVCWYNAAVQCLEDITPVLIVKIFYRCFQKYTVIHSAGFLRYALSGRTLHSCLVNFMDPAAGCNLLLRHSWSALLGFVSRFTSSGGPVGSPQPCFILLIDCCIAVETRCFWLPKHQLPLLLAA